jgi:epoxide hydrolase
MRRLGYERYGAQGGDLGAVISPDLGRADPDHVVGVHVNAASVGFMPFLPLDESELAQLSDLEKARVARIAEFLDDEFGYAQIQSTRPQTLAYALNDSPVGQLAWIVDKFQSWTHGCEVPEDAVGRDRMLTNVMLYWLTGTAGSSANVYYEDKHPGAWPQPSRAPTGVAVFAEDISIRRYAEQANNVVHWSDFDRGGHFAAMEAPDLLVGDVREFFRRFR